MKNVYLIAQKSSFINLSSNSKTQSKIKIKLYHFYMFQTKVLTNKTLKVYFPLLLKMYHSGIEKYIIGSELIIDIL